MSVVDGTRSSPWATAALVLSAAILVIGTVVYLLLP